MKVNPFNNKQSFIFKPLKIIQSLGWVAVAILTLPTVIGSYFAWKKLAAIWNENERPDVQKTADVASKVLLEEEGDEEGFVTDFSEAKNHAVKTPEEEKEELYKAAIQQFRKPGCLGSRSAEVYLGYLKSIHPHLHFDTTLLYKSEFTLDEFLEQIKSKVDIELKKKALHINPLIFVPFLLAGNALREEHIVVAVINAKDQRVEYFDPKGNQLYSIFGSLVDRNLAYWSGISSQNFLEKLSVSIFSDEKPSVIRNMIGPQSLFNKVDCEAHVLDFIQGRLDSELVPGDNPNYFTKILSSDGRVLREAMANILQFQLDAKTLHISETQK